jgi:septum formation protein
VLASASAARLRVLRDAGLDPEVVVSGVDEDMDVVDIPSAVLALAERKARAVADRRPDALVVACDSMLEADRAAMGKPVSPDQAHAWGRRLSGKETTLYTGHWLIDTRSGRTASGVDGTLVRFAVTTEAEIAAYVATGEPLGLAGAFSIEGFGAPFVEGVVGSPSNVLGLSVPLLRRMLAELGVAITDLWRRSTDDRAERR